MKLIERFHAVCHRGTSRRAPSSAMRCGFVSSCPTFANRTEPGGNRANFAGRGGGVSDSPGSAAAVDRSSQNQALNALVFLYQQVLRSELGEDHLGQIDAVRVRRPAKVPTVLSTGEVVRVLEAIEAGSMHRLMAELLYGCGLRLMECCTPLRIRDLDFERAQIIVRDGKGMKDRVVMLPRRAEPALRQQVSRVEQRWREDPAPDGGYGAGARSHFAQVSNRLAAN